MPPEKSRPNFAYRSSSEGEVLIYHGDTLAAALRGRPAQTFLSKVEGASSQTQQQLMARLTGNYKHGNERDAKSHPRNR